MERKLHIVYVKILQALDPTERGEVYEEPLAEFLDELQLGEVTGGGTLLDAAGQIVFCGIDLELYDLDHAIPLIARKLADLGAPAGSALEYEVDGQPVVRPIDGEAAPIHPVTPRPPAVAQKPSWFRKLFGRGR